MERGVPAAGASPRPTRSESIGLSDGFRCVPTAGHIGPAYEPHGQSVQECRAAPACAAVRNMGWFPTAPGQMRTGGGGKPPPYAVGINRPVRWFSMRTSGGTHRSRPTSYVGSSYVFVGDDAHIVPAVWSNDARYTRANPYQAVRKFDGAVCGPMWASAPTGRVR